VAANGLEVLEALDRQPYDVILMDVQMPEMDGEEATRFIRTEMPPEKQPYIIALTANALPGDRERLLQAGMNDYLAKPVRIRELVSTLHTFGETGAGAPRPMKSEEAIGPSGLDMAAVDRLADSLGSGGEAMVRELMHDYLKDAQRLLTDLHDAVSNGDFVGARRAAHTLKSTSNQMGALRLGGIMKEIEIDAGNNDLGRASALSSEAESELGRIRAQIEEGWDQ
jgi:CheY-like chemotaxis protein